MIDQKDYLGRNAGRDAVKCELTPPCLLLNDTVEMGNLRLKISGCVIPGLDPRNEYSKECQDAISYCITDNQLFLCLFDGHGKCGKDVA